MEPDEIATLSLTMCLDMSIASPLQDDEGQLLHIIILMLPPHHHVTLHVHIHQKC